MHIHQIDLNLLPLNAKEGDALKLNSENKFVIDQTQTKRQREEVLALLNRLKSKSDNIVL